MKRQQFVRELEQAGCRVLRQGARHEIFINPAVGRKAPVPRHNEISESLCRLIRRQLGVE